MQKTNIAAEKDLYQRNLGSKFEKLALKCKLLELTTGQKPGGELSFDLFGHMPGTNKLSLPGEPGPGFYEKLFLQT